MVKTIYKYELDINSHIQVIEMPEGAEILCVHNQYDMPCIWALVDPLAEIEKRYIEVCCTGENVPSAHRKYIGTCLFSEGTLVLHFFELIKL